MDPESVPTVGHTPHGSSDDPDLLDFSANVNPNVPSGVSPVYEEALEAARTYPPRGYPSFREAAAAYVDRDPEEVIPTAGGLQAIRLAVETTVTTGDSVLVPFPSFGEYAREIRLQGAEPSFVPHDELLAADPVPHELAVACTPNNPTGDAYDVDDLRAFAARCREADTPLLVDEAFLGFTNTPSLAGEPGVIVARSLTKLFGLPGLRAGFAVATGDHHEALSTAVPPWALGTPTARVGVHCMQDETFVTRTRERVRHERERLRDRLGGRFEVHPSDAPFLLLDVGGDPTAVVAHAREQGVAVRDATTFRGLDAHVRIAIRTPEENDRLLEALDV